MTNPKIRATKKEAAKKRGNTAKRYPDALKQKVIDFVNSVNAENGRGGVSAAARKFGASPLSISKWLKQGGGASPAGKRENSSNNNKAPGDRRNQTLSDLIGLNRAISQKRKELEGLEARFEKLKDAL